MKVHPHGLLPRLYHPETPGIPGSGLLFLDWPDTRRTDRYRVWLKKPGESAFTPVTASHAPSTDSASASRWKFKITALSAAGESVPGPVNGITQG